MTPDPIGTRLAELAGCVAEGAIRFATAESCTGGQLAAALAGHEALGSHLERGYVVYSVDAKCEMLGMERDEIERSDGVSARLTVSLAKAALDQSHADVAIAITGFCGPREGDEEVGLVHLACAADARRTDNRTCHFGEIGRRAVLDAAVAEALAMLSDAVERLQTGD